MIRKFLLFVFVITCVTVNSQFQPNYYDQLNVGSNNFQYRQPYIGYRISPGFPNRISNDASPISNNHITQSPLQQVEQNLRISEQKCKEYTELAKNSILLGSLSFRPSIQTIKSEQCGATQGLIVGGENAKPGEFPHMAALGYPYLNGIKYQCGGTLISDRYVLTAAHCRLTNNLKPSLVRLGDHNLRTKEANLPEESVPIVKFISHEQYDLKSSKNDIAIIRLTRVVTFGKFIRPACLSARKSPLDNKAIATGWGLTQNNSAKTSDVMQKVELDIIEINNCQKYYNITLDDNQVCAGELAGGKDTCQGDSGGPLQFVSDQNKCLFEIVGITSYGTVYCGRANSPGVYVRVSAYIDWIEQKVWGQ